MKIRHLIIAFLSIATVQTSSALNCASPDSSNRSFAALSIKCEKTDSVQSAILTAIDIGAPTYNQGNYLGCYRIYEGAAYKILYKYGGACIRVGQILKTAIEKSYGDFSDSEKAWIMRVAFDEILGETTRTK